MKVSDHLKWTNIKLLLEIKEKNFKLLILLFLTDLIFILIHMAHQLDLFGMLSKDLLSLSVDKSYAEVYQYIKEYWIILLLVFIGIKKKSKLYFMWALLFFYFLLDDSLQIHEILGQYSAIQFNIQDKLSLRAEDFGELVVSLFAGILLFSIIGAFHYKSSTIEKKISKSLFFLVLILILFGIGIDMIDSMIPTTFWKAIFALIEDGGEMVVMSIILEYVYNLSYLINAKEPRK